jgi:hypothetical protein
LTGNGLVAGNGSNNVDYHQSDDPFSQADGGYENPGGSEPAFSLDAGSFYHAANVVMVSSQGTALGADDIWMNGHVDGDPDKGKVSYLGGHKYTTGVPIIRSAVQLGSRPAERLDLGEWPRRNELQCRERLGLLREHGPRHCFRLGADVDLARRNKLCLRHRRRRPGG